MKKNILYFTEYAPVLPRRTPPPVTSEIPQRLQACRRLKTASTSQVETTSPRSLSLSVRRRLQAPRTPDTSPVTNRRRCANPTTPHSGVTYPQRPHVRARGRRTQSPFDRLTSELVAVEQRRLEMEEKRDRQLHERECRRLEVDNEHNQILRSIVDVAQSWLEFFKRN